MPNPVQAKPQQKVQGSAKSQVGKIAKSTAQQIFEQPSEVAKAAREQILGAPKHEVSEPAVNNGQDGQQRPVPEPSAKEKRAASHMQAFREELKEISQLKKGRQEETRSRREQQEESKKRQEEGAKKTKAPLIEPVTRRARGMLGGAMRIFGLGKKQRSVELGKTPTN